MSGLAGGSSLKDQADFNPSAVTTGKQTRNGRGEFQRGIIYKGGHQCLDTRLLSVGKEEGPSGHTEVLSRPQPQATSFLPEWVISRDQMPFSLEKE